MRFGSKLRMIKVEFYKLVYEIVNSFNLNKYKNTTVISDFASVDSIANLWNFVFPLRAQFLDIQTTGKLSVQKFVFGDYHWICDQLGHQGAAPSFSLCLLSGASRCTSWLGRHFWAATYT